MADDAIQLDLIDDIIKGNFNNAEKALHQTLAQKQNDVLDQEKIKMAGQIFNGVQPEEDEEVELSDEEIDAAIEDDEEESDVVVENKQPSKHSDMGYFFKYNEGVSQSVNIRFTPVEDI